MISVLPLRLVLLVVALIYALVATGILSCMGSTDVWYNFYAVVGWGTILNITLVLLGHVGWKAIWAAVPKLNEWVFPDLNGQWNMKIYWFTANDGGVVDAIAIIKQDLFRVSMEVHSSDSDSETLTVAPKRDSESGRPIIYYIYRVLPRKTKPEAGGAYEGAAILKLNYDDSNLLMGNYHTSRRTEGHFELRRCN